jgi:vacuolar protein sorting-associated protein IST1
VQLKLAIARLRMVQHRDEALSKQQRRAMAQLLDAGKEESARIRVENIIRSDITVELYEILELYCELLLARAGLLEAPQCDPGLEEAVKSVIYAAPKTEVKELQQVRTLLGEKFGKDFVLVAMDNSDGKVAESVVKKLSVTPPKKELVRGYLEEIAKTYGVNWPRREKQDLGPPPDAPTDDAGGGDDNPSGGQAQKTRDSPLLSDPDEARKAQETQDLSKATPPKTFGPPNPLQVNPPSPSTDNIRPRVTLNSVELKPNEKMAKAAEARKASSSGGGGGIADGVPDVADLAKRFAALKR